MQQRPNVILAAECVYFEPAFPLLMQTLKDLFVLNEDAIVYFCFKKRRQGGQWLLQQQYDSEELMRDKAAP